MKYNREKHQRRSIRLREYDYTQVGAYFVTISAHSREPIFGEIVKGKMRLNEWGKVVAFCWDEIPIHFLNVELDAFVIMPNHVHGIIVIAVDGRRGTACRAPTTEQFGKPVANSFPTIIRSFKSATTKRINEIHSNPGVPLWQRNYYERIIRDEDELTQIREYIAGNHFKWGEDEENPNKISPI